MSIDPGIGTEFSTKGFQGFFARWGAKANLRSIWNFVVPVALIDHYRGEDEGSLYGLTAETPGAANAHPAIFFGAISGVGTRDDVTLEILSISAGILKTAGGATVIPWALAHCFTPIAPYNPVLNLDPVGPFIPGMFLNSAFTRGNAIAFGGSNPSWPSYPGAIGYTFSHRRMNLSATTGWDITLDKTWPAGPIRLHPGHGLAVQFFNPGSLTLSLRVSFLYRERPFFL